MRYKVRLILKTLLRTRFQAQLILKKICQFQITRNSCRKNRQPATSTSSNKGCPIWTILTAKMPLIKIRSESFRNKIKITEFQVMWASSRANSRRMKRSSADMWGRGIPRRLKANSSHRPRKLRLWITKTNRLETFSEYIPTELLKSRLKGRSRRLWRGRQPILPLMRKWTTIYMTEGTTWSRPTHQQAILIRERSLQYHTQEDLWRRCGSRIFLQRALRREDYHLPW